MRSVAVHPPFGNGGYGRVVGVSLFGNGGWVRVGGVHGLATMKMLGCCSALGLLHGWQEVSFPMDLGTADSDSRDGLAATTVTVRIFEMLR